MTDYDRVTGRVGVLLRLMYAHRHPDKKLEINWEMLELDIMKHTAIAMVLREIPYDEGGVK